MNCKKRLILFIMVSGVVVLLVNPLFKNDYVHYGFCQEETVEENSEPGKSAELNKAEIKSFIDKADALTNQMTVESLEKAITEYKKALELNPENFEALWKIAQAYCCIIDIKTNILIIEKDEYKPILKELGKIAEGYAKKAYKINPNAKEVISVNLWAYGYRSSAMGIIKAILTGAAGHYKKLARELIEIDDTYKNAHGYKSLGRFYYMAPFPMGSKKKTKLYYEKALEIIPDLLEPHYWLGMTYLKKDKYDLAKKEFEYVVNNLPNESEKHFIVEFKREAEKQLDLIIEKEQQKIH